MNSDNTIENYKREVPSSQDKENLGRQYGIRQPADSLVIPSK